MKHASISVVIPAYDRERFVGEAIESVLAQTMSVDEIIVVDNNCTDNTVAIAEKLGARVVEEKTPGASAARNRGIKESRNEWIAFLDSDDVWEAEKIEHQSKAIEKFPDAGIVSCDYGWITESENGTIKLGEVSSDIVEDSGIILEGIYSYCSLFKINQYDWFRIIPSSVILHRDVFARIGLFDEDLLLAQDMDLLHRALALFPLATVKKTLAYLRKHEKNTSRDPLGAMKYAIKVTEKMLEFPDKYPIGAGEHFRNLMKQRFTAGSRQMNSGKQ
ncbi:MAG: glycosyltransferase family 2 protein [Acidobacteria bacterium]|nr:glycosyltransferase family 2 protein [Acidobacteriota bacterium]